MSVEKSLFWLTTILLGILILIGAGFRVINLSTRPLWDDEAWTYFISTQGWRHFLRCLPLDTQPPLFYWIEAASARASGGNEVGLRLPSLAAGLLLLGLGMWIAKRLWNTTTALLAGAFFACSPLLIYQSQEARSYSLLSLLILASAWSWWLHARSPSWRQGTVAVCLSLAAGYTHYFGLFLLPFAALSLLRAPRATRDTAWGSLILNCLGLLPLAALFVQQHEGHRNLSFGQELSLPSALLRSALVSGPGPYLEGSVKLFGYAAFGVASVLVLCCYARDHRVRHAVAFPALLAVVLLPLLYAGRLLHLWPIRDAYVTIAAPAVLMCIAGVATHTGSPFCRRLLTGLVLTGAVLGTVSLTLGDGRPNPDYRSAALYVAAHPADGILLARAYGDLPCYTFYQARPTPIAVYSVDPNQSTNSEIQVVGAPLASARSLIAKKQSLWILTKVSESSSHGISAFSQVLSEQGFVCTQDRVTRGIRLLRWDTAPRTAHVP